MSNFRGWWWSPNSRKAHYFDNEPMAICGKFMVFAVDVLRREAQDDGDGSRDNCAACKKKVAKLRALNDQPAHEGSPRE